MQEKIIDDIPPRDFPPAMFNRSRVRLESGILAGVFALALLAHGILVTSNWTAGFMAGHEFRQAQTAVITRYIDQRDDFSLLYETPILGKPWVSILLEVPVYEWSVVGLSRLAHLPHHVAARTVSLASFYLSLPALYLLLGLLGLAVPRRLLVLALVLTCPVYIFYSRAFLIDAMEFMCCAWFLLGFLRLLDRQNWPWLVLATVAGTGAALIKSATLAIWLLPAVGCGAWKLWRIGRTRAGWGAAAHTLFCGLAGVAVPLGALYGWIALTDPLKAAHASAWIFTAKDLSAGNWGLVDLAGRFSGRTWGELLDRWREAIMPPWVIGAGLIFSLVCFPAERRRVLGLAVVFFLAQVLFPYAYAYQDYYFYACAAFLLAAFGCALHAVLDSRLPRWGCWLVIAVPFAAQLDTYWRGYRCVQLVQSDGGFSYTTALRDLVPRESVIVVAGADWAAMIPLYSGHRALMIRNGLELDAAYLDRAFAELGDEDVSALVLTGGQQGNRELVERAAAAFDLDDVPTFTHRFATVYCSRRTVAGVREGLRANGNYGELIPGPARPEVDWSQETFRVSPGLARTTFGNVSPAPVRAHFAFGAVPFLAGDAAILNAHSDSDLWLPAPAAARRIEWEFGIIPGAYERNGDKTDGVEFAVVGVLPGGGERRLFDRILDPVNQGVDRGRQREVIPYAPVPGEILHFMSRSVRSYAYDWAYWARIDVK
jgi:hypothetical protein